MSEPDWAQDLTHHRHICGTPILIGWRFGGYVLSPVFQTEPGHAVQACPGCGLRLHLNDCRQEQAPAMPPRPAGRPLLA